MRIANVVIFVGLVATTARADPALDIAQAMQLAPKHHPIEREQQAAVQGADARVDVERARFWPDVQVFAQLDRSTANTTGGALFAVPGLPVVSGVPGRIFDSGAFGTAAGVTASWDTLGFRRWDAQIDAARADARAARLDASVSDLDLAYAAADRFIAVIARGEGIKATHESIATTGK